MSVYSLRFYLSPLVRACYSPSLCFASRRALGLTSLTLFSNFFQVSDEIQEADGGLEVNKEDESIHQVQAQADSKRNSSKEGVSIHQDKTNSKTDRAGKTEDVSVHTATFELWTPRAVILNALLMNAHDAE